jgi:hypothetical protein
MKIKVLSSALEDLSAGREFYDKQVEGVGEYFFDALFADIDSLALYAGIHLKIFWLSPFIGQTVSLRNLLEDGKSQDRSRKKGPRPSSTSSEDSSLLGIGNLLVQDSNQPIGL